MATTGTAVKKSFDQPDETRAFAEGTGQMDFVEVGDFNVGLGEYKPGWQWSKHVKPVAGTDSCQADHNGYVISGRMAVRMNDGDEVEIGPGEAFHIPPGHDAWVVGDESCVLYDFTAGKRFAKPS